MPATSRLEHVLSESDATVTALLEDLVGEPVEATDRRHRATLAAAPNLLGVAPGHPLLHRSAVLCGATSGQPYLQAQSVLVPSRLPGSFCRQLETGPVPIGHLLTKDGIRFTRSALPKSDELDPSTFGDAPAPVVHLLARRYRIDVDGVPAMVIGEWFLPALDPFLGSPSEGVAAP
ncbi:MAG: hypothetical protein JO368_10935 [Acidimicrobiales bacterium]|nr:hypothetical protein [Acidimicrobiales bacterium]